MFKHVVVPLDGTARAEAALEPARGMARRVGADVRLVSMVKDAEVKERLAYLEKLAADMDVPVTTEVLPEDDPAAQIADLAASRQPGLVVMATHGHRPLGAAVLGSVGLKVVHDGGCPVMMVGPHYEHRAPGWSMIVVALDRSGYSEAVLPLASKLSVALEIPLQLVEVVEPVDPNDIPPDVRLDLSEAGYLQHVAASLSGVDCSWDVLHDPHPAPGLTSYIERLPGAPLLVMATHGRSGRQLATLGSVATAVLHRATFPVMLLRPEGLDDEA